MPSPTRSRDPAKTRSAANGRWLIEPADTVVIVRDAACDEPEPSDWRRRLAESLGVIAGAGVVGARRETADGRLFSMGELVIHPKGFHHLGAGLHTSACRFPEEVDAVCGGVLALPRDAFEAAGGAAVLERPLGALELCLGVRSSGGRCLVVPDVRVVDSTSPLQDDGIGRSEDRDFEERWGFHWRAADLDAVRIRHAGSGLLWNARFLGRPMPFEKYDDRPAVHWRNYETVDVYRARADHLAGLVRQHAGEVSAAPRVLDLGCGDGLFTHLFALGGAAVVGVDPEPIAIEQAVQEIAAHDQRGAYPGSAPTCTVAHGEALAFDEGAFDVVAMLDVIEHLPNPVAVLREVQRVLAPGGRVVVSTPSWQFGAWSDPVYHVCEYTLPELVGQVQAATSLRATHTGSIGGVYRDIIVIAEKGKVG